MSGKDNLGLTQVQMGDPNKESLLNTNEDITAGVISEPLSVVFATDATKTLTASDVLGKGILIVTSGVSLTATRDLIVPANKRPYWVKNGTTGGQSIRIKNSGGTGVTITNGSRVIVYNDGTNMEQYS